MDETAPAGGGPASGSVPAEPPPVPPWRSAPRRRSVPRPQLSRALVVAAALEVVKAEGGDGLTMRRVADQIGVSASSLYGYVTNKEELVQLVLEHIITELRPPPEGDWQESMKSFAREMLGVFRRHPGVAGLTLGRVPFGPAMLPVAERMLAALRAAGMPDQVAAFAGDLGGLYVGAIAYEEEVTPISDKGDFAAQAAAWLKSLPPGQFPNIVATADKLMAGSADDRFEWGLDVLVRGLASYLTDPPTAAAHWPAT